MTFGFDGARGTNVRPAHKVAVSSWAKDESAPGANDGTILTASWANRIAGNFRQLATRFGVTLTESSDEDLADCIVAAIEATDPKTHDHDDRYYAKATVDGLVAALAPLASPVFTGIPVVPTAAPGTNTGQMASTAFVQAAVAALINSAPGALDTLDELAAALGDDANFAATVTAALAGKAPLASPALTGTPTAPTAAPGTNTGQLATTAFVAAAVAAVPGLTDGDKGDITVSGSGASWAIDANAITYAKMQDISATSRVLGRRTAGAGDPEECTLSQILDFIGSAAQGDILYRGASGWARLGAGTSGHYLRTQGAGADPQWAAVSTSAFPAGTALLFQQTSAPTGWTKQTTHNDKALRVVSGTASSGGSTGFTAAMVNAFNTGSTTLTTTQIPSHDHTVNRSTVGGASLTAAMGSGSEGTLTTSAAGSGGSHNHTVQLNVAYVDVIIATKD